MSKSSLGILIYFFFAALPKALPVPTSSLHNGPDSRLSPGALDLAWRHAQARYQGSDDHAARLYRHALATKDPKSEYELGCLYERGQGVKQVL